MEKWKNQKYLLTLNARFVVLLHRWTLPHIVRTRCNLICCVGKKVLGEVEQASSGQVMMKQSKLTGRNTYLENSLTLAWRFSNCRCTQTKITAWIEWIELQSIQSSCKN